MEAVSIEIFSRKGAKDRKDGKAGQNLRARPKHLTRLCVFAILCVFA